MRSSILQAASRNCSSRLCLPSVANLRHLHPMPVPRRMRKPLRLIVDYDGTLTVEDTMAILGSIPWQPTIAWKEFEDKYMQDYEKYKQQSLPWKKYDAEEYSAWLAARKEIEHDSAQRVQASLYFKGVTTQDVRSTISSALDSGKLRLRDHWISLIELFLHASPATIEILSVNWSETAIREALYQSADRQLKDIDSSRKEEICRYITNMKITANEIEGLASPQGSSGHLIRPSGTNIRTSDDKLHYLQSLPTKVDDVDLFTVYIGDSGTDFDCLRAADLGIWLCDVPRDEYVEASKRTFQPLNLVPPPLEEVAELKTSEPMFYWAANFQVVLDVLTKEESE